LYTHKHRRKWVIGTGANLCTDTNADVDIGVSAGAISVGACANTDAGA
jgi:hypothetical protein